MSMFSMSSAKVDVGSGGGLFEGVEVDHHHVDGLDTVLLDGGSVFGFAADVQHATVDVGMQRLDAAVQHLRKAGEIGDVADGQAGFARVRAVPPVETSSTP